MARPREFDIETVLHEAMELFWKQGFDGTSFADLEARTGVKKASLFAAYGDKRSLYLKVLQAYQEAGRASARAMLVEGAPRAAVRRWFTSASTGATKGDCSRRGCLQVNSVVERADCDPEVVALARKHGDLLVGDIAGVIRRGQKAGEFRADIPAPDLARYLVTTLHGLSVAAKAGLANSDIKRVADITLSALES